MHCFIHASPTLFIIVIPTRKIYTMMKARTHPMTISQMNLLLYKPALVLAVLLGFIQLICAIMSGHLSLQTFFPSVIYLQKL